MNVQHSAQPASARLVARRLGGIPAIEAIRDRWQALALTRPANRPFAGPGFIIAALKAFHGSASTFVWLVEREAALEALMPFVVRPLRRVGMEIAEVGCPNNPHFLISDALLADNDRQASEVTGSLMSALLSERCDTILLQHIAGLATIKRMVASARAAGFGCDGLEPSRDLYFITCGRSYDDYLATRSGDFRWQLKKRIRRAMSAGVAVEILMGRKAIEAALPIWFDIERKSWQGSTPTAAMSDADRKFMKLLLAELPDDEVGELWLLHVGGERAAALRMLGGTNRTCVHTMHFDQRYADLSPGTLLLNAMLKSAWDRRLIEVDLHGNSSHFRRWATGKREHFTARLYKPGPVGLALRKGRHVYRAMNRSNGGAP